MRGAPISALLLAVQLSLGCTTAEAPGRPKVEEKFYPVCVGATAVPDTSGNGATFAELYRDLFARAGAAKCQESGCHGGGSGQGEIFMGNDRRDAYCGLICTGLVSTADTSAYDTCDCPQMKPDVPDGGITAEAVGLLTTVAPKGAAKKAQMPNPACVDYDKSIPHAANRDLTIGEIARIERWVDAGAKNDGVDEPGDAGSDAAPTDAQTSDAASSDAASLD